MCFGCYPSFDRLPACDRGRSASAIFHHVAARCSFLAIDQRGADDDKGSVEHDKRRSKEVVVTESCLVPPVLIVDSFALSFVSLGRPGWLIRCR